MKAFFVLDGSSQPIAVATSESMAEDLMFAMTMNDGLVDEEGGTFDFGGLSLLDVDMQTLRESLMLTGEELTRLEEEGAVLL